MSFCPDEKALETYAGAIIREVPLGSLGNFVSNLGDELAMGNACGQGCGSGCGGNCITTIDPYGHAGLTLTQLNSIVRNKLNLRTELVREIDEIGKSLQGLTIKK